MLHKQSLIMLTMLKLIHLNEPKRLEEKARLLTAASFSRELSMSASYAEQLVGRLKEAGFLTGKRGPAGGYYPKYDYSAESVGVLLAKIAEGGRTQALSSSIIPMRESILCALSMPFESLINE